jgi:tyrosinase
MPDNEALLETSLQRSKPFLRDLAPKNTYLEWLVNVKALKHAINGALTVHVFLGPIEEDDVLLWPASPNHVGTFATFGQGPDTRCGLCKEDQAERMQVTGQIPLTLALVERYLPGILPDIRVGTVVPYLTRELHWRGGGEG